MSSSVEAFTVAVRLSLSGAARRRERPTADTQLSGEKRLASSCRASARAAARAERMLSLKDWQLPAGHICVTTVTLKAMATRCRTAVGAGTEGATGSRPELAGDGARVGWKDGCFDGREGWEEALEADWKDGMEGSLQGSKGGLLGFSEG